MDMYTPVNDWDIRVGSFVRIRCNESMNFVNSEMEKSSGHWFCVAAKLLTAANGEGRYDLVYKARYNQTFPPLPRDVRTMGWVWRAYMFDAIMHTPPSLSANLLGKELLPDI